jgi:hypothetical protein
MPKLMLKKSLNSKESNLLLRSALRRQKRLQWVNHCLKTRQRKKIMVGNSQSMRQLPCRVSTRINLREFARSNLIWVNSILIARFWAKHLALKLSICSLRPSGNVISISHSCLSERSGRRARISRRVKRRMVPRRQTRIKRPIICWATLWSSKTRTGSYLKTNSWWSHKWKVRGITTWRAQSWALVVWTRAY